MDISAALTAPFVPADSVPGQVTLGCGGVARNIAHNLRLMGHEVKFVSAFGGEIFGEMCWRECQAIGLDLTLSERCEGMRNGLYLCVNDQSGEMRAAVADTEIISCITPEFLEARISDINRSKLVIADRLAAYVSDTIAQRETYKGFYILLAVFFYTIRRDNSCIK